MTVRLAPLDTVRAAIADCCLGSAAEVSQSGCCHSSPQIGSVTLRPHQADGLEQLTGLIDTHGGAVLADAVGMGKTYVALAVARRAGDVLVVCPAILRDAWHRSARDTGVTIRTVSMEQLSRERGEAACGNRRPDLVVVDEAHHFRNPHTRRYHALARATTSARVLLLTATPVHNRTEDLACILSLFLGAHAWTLTDDQRSRYVVRRGHDAARSPAPARSLQTPEPHRHRSPDSPLSVPRVIGPHIVRIDDDAETLQALVALPPPVPPRDGECADALTAMGLIRQWASSAGALRSALRRRLDRAAALEASLEQGAYPSYRALREWCVGEGTIQLALPDLLTPAPPGESEQGRAASRPPDIPMLLSAVREHAGAVRQLLRRLSDAPDLDASRADHLQAIMRAHPHARVVGFSSFEDTVHALFRQLRTEAAICALSARGGVIASGRLRRAEVLRQFAPGSAERVARAERIQLLLTTDLLSEGVDLQAAAVVVHLDLPWTPARLEQRIGRIARLGSPHDSVHVYAFAPPAASEALLQVEQRLQAKLDAAGRAVGIVGSIVPQISASWGRARGDGPQVGPPEHLATVRAIMSTWRRSSSDAPPAPDETLWAAVTGPARGFLAACVVDARPLLVASAGTGVSDAPAAVAAAAAATQSANCARVATDAMACHNAIGAIRAWWSERCATEDVGLSTVADVASRHRVLRRIAAISRRSPLHARPSILALGERARRAATAPFGAGAEWVLDQLAGAALPDAQWLRAVAAFGDAHALRGSHTLSGRAIVVRALIVCGAS